VLSVILVAALSELSQASDALTIHYYSAGHVYDPALMAFRPGRVSLASTRSSTSWSSMDSSPGSRRSSTSSLMSHDTNSSVYSTPQIALASFAAVRSTLPAQQRISRSTKPPIPMFKRLPQEIYDCILEQLKVLHSNPLSASCATCYLRDLYSLALTSRAWDRAVRIKL